MGILIIGNYWFYGDDDLSGVCKGGIIIMMLNCKMVIIGNYVDNNFIEWINEYDVMFVFGIQYFFGGLMIIGNIFIVNDIVLWFNWIVVKFYGLNYYIYGLIVIGNVF